MLHHWLDCWRGVGGRRRRDAPSGMGPSIDRVRQRTLAGDVLRDRDGALNHGRLSLRTDTVAGEATGGMGGGEAAALKGLSLGWRAGVTVFGNANSRLNGMDCPTKDRGRLGCLHTSSSIWTFMTVPAQRVCGRRWASTRTVRSKVSRSRAQRRRHRGSGRQLDSEEDYAHRVSEQSTGARVLSVIGVSRDRRPPA